MVQPRDRGDWISGIRRAVDLSSGGQLDQGETRLNADDDDGEDGDDDGRDDQDESSLNEDIDDGEE